MISLSSLRILNCQIAKSQIDIIGDPKSRVQTICDLKFDQNQLQ